MNPFQVESTNHSRFNTDQPAVGAPAAPIDLLQAPVQFKTVEGAAAGRDDRARFRDVFCSIMQADGLALAGDETCKRWLWRLPDEAPEGGRPGVAHMEAGELVVFLVTGAFSECVGD